MFYYRHCKYQNNFFSQVDTKLMVEERAIPDNKIEAENQEKSPLLGMDFIGRKVKEKKKTKEGKVSP